MLPADRDLVFLHGLEQGGLGFGRGAVDFVGQHDVGKDRPADKAEVPLPVARSWSMISVPVMSLGIRSGVNWIRLKFMASAWASVEMVRVLASPGTPMVRQWPRANSADEHLLDHLVLADDDLVDLLHQGVAGLGDAANRFLGTHLGGGGRHRTLLEDVTPGEPEIQVSGLARPFLGN